jgi:hypothetical protein
MPERLEPNEELAAALAEKLAVQRVEAMAEMYTQVDTNLARGVRLVSVMDTVSAVPDNPGSAAAVAGASVSLAGRLHWPQPVGAPTYRHPNGSRIELSQQEPNRPRLIPVGGSRDRRRSHFARQHQLRGDPLMRLHSMRLYCRLAGMGLQERRRSYEAHAREVTRFPPPGEHGRPEWDEACRPHDRARAGWERDSSVADERY